MTTNTNTTSDGAGAAAADIIYLHKYLILFGPWEPLPIWAAAAAKAMKQNLTCRQRVSWYLGSREVHREYHYGK